MKKLLLLFLSSILFSGGAAYAGRAKLVHSTPEDGSVSNGPPATFVLEFSEYVMLREAYIKTDDGKETALQHLPQKDLKTITIPAPSLTAGHYTLEWQVFTHDSYALNGRIRFTISAQ
jgi:methionine-rich copper-binding protein CopC